MWHRSRSGSVTRCHDPRNAPNANPRRDFVVWAVRRVLGQLDDRSIAEKRSLSYQSDVFQAWTLVSRSPSLARTVPSDIGNCQVLMVPSMSR